MQSRYYDPELGRFINADAYASTGQGVLGNNMFAYCNNNPVFYLDASGTAARICISEDTRINVQPWRDFSPGGGGSRATSSGIYAPDYGSVADKFYTVRALRFVGTQITHSAHKLWDAYEQGYKMQQEAQLRETELIAEVSPRIRKAGRTGGSEAFVSGFVETAIIYFAVGMDPKIALISIGAIYAGGYVEGVYKEIVKIYEENYQSQ